MTETAFAIALFAFGLLALAPLLANGLRFSARAADRQAVTRVMEAFVEEAREGSLAAGTFSVDDQGRPAPAGTAAFRVEASFASLDGQPGAEELKLRIVPRNAPRAPQTFAAVLPATAP